MKNLIILLSVICLKLVSSENSLELDDKYHLKWNADKKEELIIFEITAETKGYVGFGLSFTGSMKDADIVTGGVKDGIPYLQDRHGIGQTYPPEDDVNDYKLIEAYENDTHTYIKFSRDFNTCDPEDLPITGETIKIIWGLGDTDEINYHLTRGIKTTNLIDGIPLNPDLSKYKTWKIRKNIELPSKDTTYWCSLFKEPNFGKKHQIIGYNAYIPNEIAKKHVHHIDVYKCNGSPKNESLEDFFNNGMSEGGIDCSDGNTFEYCQLFSFTWAIGGLVTMFPKDVGIPISHKENSTYYMMEVHLDNPDEIKGLKLETGMDFYYTDKIRKHDGGFLAIGHEFTYSLMIPPNSEDLVISGHCSSNCTQNIPEDGFNIFSTLLHSHMSGRKFKVRHFRGEEELPWVIKDFHYDFNYQQNRPLNPEVKLMPGDQLTVECHYNSKWRNGEVTIGGLSTRDEMCYAIMIYYPAYDEINTCSSYFPLKKMTKYFGIENVTQEPDYLFYQDPEIIAPESMKGKKFTQVVKEIDWTPEKRIEYQDLIHSEEQFSSCFPFVEFESEEIPEVTYPQLKRTEEFTPNDICVNKKRI